MRLIFSPLLCISFVFVHFVSEIRNHKSEIEESEIANMSVFKSIARSFVRSAIANQIAQSKRKRSTCTLDSARSVLILFDATDALILRDFEAFDSQNTNKEIFCFKYIAKDQTAANGFSSKQTNFADTPKAEVVARCNELQADLLVLFNPDDLPSLHYLATAHPAGMKVSTHSDFVSDADLVFDRKGRDLAGYLAELEQFMKKILV
jgi:hypothetical protein